MRKMNKKGFTLVELMVVLAILGLLAAIGVPQYTKVMERARIGRDVAAIATIQASVSAFLTETQFSSDEDTVMTDPSKVTGVSKLTGGSVTLAQFIDAADLPTLESDPLKNDGTTWHIKPNGVVYAKNGETTLPQQP